MQLKDYWIQKVKDIYEFQCIAEAEQSEVDMLKSKVKSFPSEIIVKTATNEGLARYEKQLGIERAATRDERVDTILMNLNNSLPFTRKYLINLLDNVLGHMNYEVSVKGYNLSLKVDSSKENVFNILRKELRKKIPANIGMSVNILESINADQFIGMYVRTADTITIEVESQSVDEGTLSVVGKAVVGKWVVGKEN